MIVHLSENVLRFFRYSFFCTLAHTYDNSAASFNNKQKKKNVCFTCSTKKNEYFRHKTEFRTIMEK